jgi:sulfite reductase beta subunit-like hemoprotein
MRFDPAMARIEHIKHAKDGLDVLDDLHRYASEGFSRIAADDFARMRWYGLYQQKPNDGHFMWRIKVPAGRLVPAQLAMIGSLANRYGRGAADLTTRQDVQLHWLRIEDLPDCLASVRSVGLDTRFACGDTPRNVVSCPLDGILAEQILPLGGLVTRIADRLHEAGKAVSNLPRKFKVSVSACPQHCCQPQINDVAAFGVRRGDGSRGVGIMVGGGLSAAPHFAQSLRIFIPEDALQEQVTDVVMAACWLFRDTDELRYRRTHARLKFLVAEKGWQWVRKEIERRLGYALIHDESIVEPRGASHTDHMGIGLQRDGLACVGVPVALGHVTGDQLLALARLAEMQAAPGRAEIRLTQKQNLLLPNVPWQRVDELAKALGELGLSPQAPRWRSSLVCCTGSRLCNLAVAETKEPARKLLEHLEREIGLDTPLTLAISGCPNSCAHTPIADIGLRGAKVQWQGEKVDAFDVYVGGGVGESPAFGFELLRRVPTALVPQVLTRLVRGYLHCRNAAETFRSFVSRTEPERLRALAAIPEWTPTSAEDDRLKS